MRIRHSVIAAILFLLLFLVGTAAAVSAASPGQAYVQAHGERGTVTFPSTPVFGFDLSAHTTSDGVVSGRYAVTSLATGTVLYGGSVTCVLTGLTDSSGNPAAIVGGVLDAGAFAGTGWAVGVSVGSASSFITLTNLDLAVPTDCSDPAVNLFATPAAVLPILDGKAAIRTH
jgi:hypothetical protein